MIIENNHEQVFTEEWIKKCFSVENIPDNSLFYSYFFDENKSPNLHHYLKFNGDFYYFRDRDSKLIKMNSKHEFYKTKSLNNVLATGITLEDIDDFWKKYIDSLQKEAEIKANSYELTDEDLNVFNAHGIVVQTVSGATGYNKQSSAIHYDGVQYCIRLYGQRYEEKSHYIANQLASLERIKGTHHSIIKDICHYLIETLNTPNIFVVLEGGLRIQASFNYSGGHLANLVLDMDISHDNLNKQAEKLIMIVNKSNMFFQNLNHDQLKFIYQ